MQLRKLLKNKKGIGLLNGLIGGVAILVVVTIVTLVAVQVLNDAKLLKTGTGSDIDMSITVNTTSGAVLTECDAADGGEITAITAARNATGNDDINVANFTFDDCYVVIADGFYNTTADYGNSTNGNISYTYSTKGDSQQAVDRMQANFTKGADNVSAKIPTILLIAAVVILFGAIVLLVQRSRSMTSGEGGL